LNVTRYQNVQWLDNTATRLTILEGPRTAMKNCILHIAEDLNVLVTVGNIPGGLRFWRSTDEDPQ
jgi:hypothetical protein